MSMRLLVFARSEYCDGTIKWQDGPLVHSVQHTYSATGLLAGTVGTLVRPEKSKGTGSKNLQSLRWNKGRCVSMSGYLDPTILRSHGTASGGQQRRPGGDDAPGAREHVLCELPFGCPPDRTLASRRPESEYSRSPNHWWDPAVCF